MGRDAFTDRAMGAGCQVNICCEKPPCLDACLLRVDALTQRMLLSGRKECVDTESLTDSHNRSTAPYFQSLSVLPEDRGG